jgi:hypothetical protein
LEKTVLPVQHLRTYFTKNPLMKIRHQRIFSIILLPNHQVYGLTAP